MFEALRTVIASLERQHSELLARTDPDAREHFDEIDWALSFFDDEDAAFMEIDPQYRDDFDGEAVIVTTGPSYRPTYTIIDETGVRESFRVPKPCNEYTMSRA